jgi:hypothetical protein
MCHTALFDRTGEDSADRDGWNPTAYLDRRSRSLDLVNVFSLELLNAWSPCDISSPDRDLLKAILSKRHIFFGLERAKSLRSDRSFLHAPL